jgi:hypothetical protein
MSEILCYCGQYIPDSTQPSEYASTVIKESDLEQIYDGIEFTKIELDDSRKQPGNRADVIKKVLSDAYPLDLNDAVVISDVLCKMITFSARILYECPFCRGLLYQEEPGSVKYAYYIKSET